MNGLRARRKRLSRSVIQSLQMFAGRPLRTALSISGLLVGVAAVIVMVAVAEGAERRLLERVQAMGTNLLVVSAAPAPRVLGRPRQVPTYTMLRTDDAGAIGEESARAVTTAPAVIRQIIVRADGLNTPTMLLGTTTDGLGIRNIRAGAGRLFTLDDDREHRRVALLGPTTARNLFGQIDPVGHTIRIGFAPFDVIGVTRPQGVDPAGVDQDNRVVVPLGTAMRRLLNIPYVDAVFVQARTSGDLVPLEREVRDILHRRLGTRSGTSDPFVIQNQAVLLRTERETARAMNRLIAAVAVLAFLVGSVGIVAVMLISVRERTPEIGLRRALGAKRRDIRHQFVIESAVLATVGGVGGVIVGTVVAGAAALFGPWDLVVSWHIVLLGLACSTVVGLVVGVIPAARAAYLEPVAALRTQ